MFKVQGSTDATTHSINEDEHRTSVLVSFLVLTHCLEQFALHINGALSRDADLASLLPIDPYEFEDLYQKCKTGLVLRLFLVFSLLLFSNSFFIVN